MEILVTGVNGFLGRTIANELANDHKLSGLSRSSGEYKVSLENEMPNFIKNFDLVIHSAGKAHSVPKTESEKVQFHNVNVIGTENLLKGLEKTFLPKQFVFISSVSVYGLETGYNINEDHPLLAKDAYGLSKIEAEKIVLKWCRKNNVVCTVLRLPLLVGENPPGNLRAMLRAIDKGYYFNIGSGIAKKSMVLGKDVAAFLPIVAPIGGVYNLTDGFHPNVHEFSFAISLYRNKRKPLNLPLIVVKVMGYVGDFIGEKAPINSLKIKKITSDLTFDDSRARNLLNWNPQPVLEYLKTKLI
jgi:nucleoside-diphosphate-sugar epimerase